MKKKKKVIKRLRFKEAYRMIWEVRPEISEWRFRQDINDGLIDVIRRETKERNGWLFFEPEDVEKYIKSL